MQSLDQYSLYLATFFEKEKKNTEIYILVKIEAKIFLGFTHSPHPPPPPPHPPQKK